MKAKQHYAYQVGGIGAATREAARIIQRTFRDPENPKAATPRIIQKIVTERIVR